MQLTPDFAVHMSSQQMTIIHNALAYYNKHLVRNNPDLSEEFQEEVEMLEGMSNNVTANPNNPEAYPTVNGWCY